MDISFKKLTQPTQEIAAAFNKWENDPALIPFLRPNRTKDDLEKREAVTVESLTRRLEHDEIHLIYWGEQLVGEMNYQADPKHLYKKESGTAWIGINIGEESARGKGVGAQAMKYLEEQVKARGFKRIELGVFEFNANAIKLYQRILYRTLATLCSN